MGLILFAYLALSLILGDNFCVKVLIAEGRPFIRRLSVVGKM